jgi:hypothetical protein
VEMHLALTRSAAASSLGIDEYGLDKKFASNCIKARIKTLEKARLVCLCGNARHARRLTSICIYCSCSG